MVYLTVARPTLPFYSHANNTLTIMYTKPPSLVELDQKRWKEAFQLANK